MRQPVLREFDPEPGVSVATLSYEYPAGYRVPEHAHGSGQVIYAIRGVMEVSAGPAFWIVPPQFALWMPPRVRHRIRMPGAVSMRTLYLQPGLARRLPATCKVIHVSPLLRELVVHAARLGRLRAAVRAERALRDLLLAQLAGASPVPMSITLPRDRRALAVAEELLADAGGTASLAALASKAGASARTIQRAFRAETGTTFECWRQQLRLMKAVELLVDGLPVKEVAYRVGYAQAGAFASLFRRTFGATPKAWMLENLCR